MSDELRSPLIAALEEFTADLVIEKYDDPYLAFVVLVHPDRHPSIVSLSGRGSHDMTILVTTQEGEEPKRSEEKGRLFSFADFEDAAKALHNAQSAWRNFYLREDKTAQLGQHIDATVRERWQASKDRAFTAALEKAAFEESHKAQCPNCSRRFTERGLAQHQSRSSWDGCRTGDVAPPEERPPAPHRVGCPMQTCRWTGLSDALSHHMSESHDSRYVVG
jgi:hypothetical protein